MDTLTGMKRTDYCGNFTTEQIGQEVTVYGWAQRQRDLGNLIFIDLRDRTGILQLSFNDATDREILPRRRAYAASMCWLPPAPCKSERASTKS